MAQGLERSFSNQKVSGLIPVFPSVQADVCLGKILNPFLTERVLHIEAMGGCKTEL